MTQQTVRDGHNLVTWPSGNANEPTNVFWGYAGVQRCHLNGDYHDVDKLREQGYTFTPLHAISDAEIEALELLVTGGIFELGDKRFRAAETTLRNLLARLKAQEGEGDER